MNAHLGANGSQSSFSTDFVERLFRQQLPIPGRPRWQPLRAGLVNIFLFEDERFPFADGRLLIRGINASGKSRALAFLLPFLLDANLSATRLEPDRDARRYVPWNLLMGEHHDRLGYSWLELGRIDPERGAEYLTLGCGLKAIKDRGIVEHWFFSTTRRMDADLHLLTPQRTALTRRQLSEAVGDRGQVFERAQDYRRLVDEQLFGLGERYDYLIELLLSLRQPQLAKKLELEQLELALQESLPPLTERLLTTAAEAFRSLDEDRRQLREARHAWERVAAFLDPYRHHVRAGLRRSAEQVLRAQRKFENDSRKIRNLEQQVEELQLQQQDLTKAHLRAQQQAEDCESQIRVLQDSEAARSAQRLTDLRGSVEQAALALQRQSAGFDNAEQQTQRLASRLQESAERLSARQQTLARQAVAAGKLAVPDPLARLHDERFGPLQSRDARLSAEADQVFGLFQKEILRWNRQAERLKKANEELRELHQRWQALQSILAQREAQQQAQAQRVTDCSAAIVQCRNDLWQSIHDWLQTAAEMLASGSLPPDPSTAWFAWAELAEGRDPIAAASDIAFQKRLNEIAAEQAASEQQSALLDQRVQVAEQELERLRSGGDIIPPAPATCDVIARETRPGAPLWRLIDFVPSVPSAEHAGWEAALQSSGLLDAWLLPSGRLENERCDVFVQVEGDALPWDRQLARVVQFAGSVGDIRADMLNAVLQRIGVGFDAGNIWVSQAGHWQNGPLRGHWRKDDAEFIGAIARERNRQRRMRSLQQEIDSCHAEQLRHQEVQATLQHSVRQLDELRQRYPSDQRLRNSLLECAAAEGLLAEAEAATQIAAGDEGQAKQAHTECRDERNRLAQEQGLSEWAERPAELQEQLRQYETQLKILQRDFVDTLAAEAVATRDAADHSAAASELATARQHLATTQQDVRRQQVELQTLEATMGTAEAEISRQLTAARSQLQTANAAAASSYNALADATAKINAKDEQLTELTAAIAEQNEARRTTIAALQSLVQRGLLAFVEVQSEPADGAWSLTQGVDLAREIDRACESSECDDDAWTKSQTRLHQAYQTLSNDLASHNLTPDLEVLADGLQLVQVAFRGALLRIDQLVVQLRSEADERELVLSEKERQVFEDFMLGEVGAELHHRLTDAAEQIERMNSEVTCRPMSTGMQMRFRWELAEDASDELRAAREILARAQATWSADERQLLIAFLQKRIQAERDQDPSAAWQAHLQLALDYRRWHVLRILRRANSGQNWSTLTRRTYATLSGGEKAIALTVPQCAAAAAYYASAHPHAPRFILLDEAFAGVSTDNRGSCLEMLVAFDLDVVMTSENERGCYPGVPALAICRLSRAADLKVVLNDVFIWNGKQQQGPFDPAALAAANEEPAEQSPAAKKNGELF